MTEPVAIVRSFYDKLKAGDAPGALRLMAHDIEWITVWHYKVNGRGPDRVAEDLFKPLMAEWSTFAMKPAEFLVDGDTVVSLGRFSGVHGITGKSAEAGSTHVWTVKDGNDSTLPPVQRYTRDRRSAPVMIRPPLPPFTAATATQKVRAAEDAWNTRNPAAIVLAYSPDSRWRNRTEFLSGRLEIEAFLTRKWANELDYRPSAPLKA